MDYVMLFTIGWILGSLATYFVFIKTKPTGVLEVDCSDPEKDKYLLRLDDLSKVDKSNLFVLKVKHINELSQK